MVNERLDGSGQGSGAGGKIAARVVGSKQAEALKIVRRHTLYGGGAGLIQGPFYNQALVAGVLIKMLHDLAALYGSSLSDHKAKTIVAAVLGGFHADWITHYGLKNVGYLWPTLSRLGGFILRPAVSGTVVYTIGRLFVIHFERGAWLERADPAALPVSEPAAA